MSIISKYLSASSKVNRLAREFKNLDTHSKQEYVSRLNSKYAGLRLDTKLNLQLIADICITVNYTFNIDLYKEQIACALALVDGNFAELKTGEGKTYAVIIAAIYLAFKDKVYCATVNEYLALRDADKCKLVSAYFGKSCRFIGSKTSNKESIYSSCDIIYSSCENLIFDYLSDGYFYSDKKLFTNLSSVIIDEVDFVLIDNACSDFSVSLSIPQKISSKTTLEYESLYSVCKLLNGTSIQDDTSVYNYYTKYSSYDYLINKSTRTAALTEKGLLVVENALGISWDSSHLDLYSKLVEMLVGLNLYEENVDYVCANDSIGIINKCSGRVSENSYYHKNLHYALERKHLFNYSSISTVENSLSYQLFFSKFNHLCGLSGTLDGLDDELYDLFGVGVVRIPSHFKSACKQHKTILKDTTEEMEDYITEYITKLRKKSDCPILIIANSDKEALEISDNLGTKLKHEVLISDESDESEKINRAGSTNNILVSTVMSSRGTDIQTEHNEDLFVIATVVPSNNRVKRQIEGRTSRQGRKGNFKLILAKDNYSFSCLNQSMYSKLSEPNIQRNLDRIVDTVSSREKKQRENLFISSLILDNIKLNISSELKHIKKSPVEFIGGWVQRICTAYQEKYPNKLLFGVDLPKNGYNNYLVTVVINKYAEKLNELGEYSSDILYKVLSDRFICTFSDFSASVSQYSILLSSRKQGIEKSILDYSDRVIADFNEYINNAVYEGLVYFLGIKLRQSKI